MSAWMRTGWNCVWMVALCALVQVRAAGAASPVPLRGPEPAWVAPIANEIEPAAQMDQDRDTATLLWDTRIRLGAGNTDRYFRFAAQALNASGVERLAEVLVDFDPSFQTLTLHRIGVWRQGRLLDQRQSAKVRIVAQEGELERRVYNGSLSAYIVLNDVRAGDIVDVSYTVHGENPVLGRRYAGEVRLAGNNAVRRRHVEITHDAKRAPLQVKVRGISAEPLHPTGSLWVWDLRDVQPLPNEDRVPSGTPEPSVQLSEFATWQDVSRWGAALYPHVSQSLVTAQAQSLAPSASQPEDIALALTRFVQDDIRYLAIATGENSLRPHAPLRALQQRLGDCKDKAYLLMHLLQARGIASVPVLVNTELKRYVADELPTPFAFDHVILRIDLGGLHYYVDPTHSLQGGRLSTQVPPNYELGLALEPGNEKLEAITDARSSSPERNTVTRVNVAPDESAGIEVTTSLIGSEADATRHRLASSSLKDFADRYANYYQRAFPELTVETPLTVQDDRLANSLRLTEHYRVAHFWRDGERTLYPDSIDYLLEQPHVVRRALPLEVDHPAWVRETFEVTLPSGTTIQPGNSVFEDAAVRFQRNVTVAGAVVNAVYEYKSLADAVPVAALQEHLSLLQRASNEEGLYLDNNTQNTKPARRKDSDTGALILGLAVSLLFMAWFARMLWKFSKGIQSFRRRLRFRRKRDGKTGDTPADPMVVATNAAAEAVIKRARCECGGSIGARAVEFNDLRYDGRLIFVGRADCESCGRPVRTYFILSG